MPSTQKEAPGTSLLQEAAGLSLTDFLALGKRERAAAARAAAPDLHALLTAGTPARTRDLGASLVRALARDGKAAGAAAAGRVVTDDLLRRECDRDQNVYLGRLFTRWLTRAVPDLVFLPDTSAEVGTALAWARTQDVPVTLRGAASTAMGGAVPANGGLVLDLSRLDSIEIDRAQAGQARVSIGAGVRMRPLHAELHERGLALPVYTSNLGGTYAGWLATGGIGLNAFGRGRALDAVHSADIVLPTGEAIRLARDGAVETRGPETRVLEGDAARDWFAERGLAPLRLADVAGTEGQLGVLVGLELAVEPLTERAGFLLAFESRADALRAVDWVAERARAGAAAPGDLKLLSASHVHHVGSVWEEEDRKDWRALPGKLSSESDMPWTRIVPPAELGVAKPLAEATAETAARSWARAYVLVDFLGANAGRAFAGDLAECPGSPRVLAAASERFARERFRPQQIKRLGPGLLAAEILIPRAHVAGFLPAAERLASKAGLELDAEVYYLQDGTALVLAGFLADHRRGSFPVDLLLGPALLDLAIARFEGRPYVLGRWQANLLARKVGTPEARRLRDLKRALDPARIVNRGAFFDMGLRIPLGPALARTIGPAVRALRLAVSAAPLLAAGARWLLDRFPGPAAGRGFTAEERPIASGASEDARTDAATATGRAIACVNCGECNSVCPIFHDAKIRLPQMLTHVGEDLHAGAAIDASGSALLDLCVRCGNCEEVCQAGIPHLPLYRTMQNASNAVRPHAREQSVLALERLRGSHDYLQGFLGARPGGYIGRAPAALPGSARFLLLRAENETGPASTCIHCGACVDVCPTGANKEYEGEDPRWITTEQERCIGCGTCVEVCPANHANGGQTLRVMEAPTLDWLAARREFAAREEV